MGLIAMDRRAVMVTPDAQILLKGGLLRSVGVFYQGFDIGIAGGQRLKARRCHLVQGLDVGAGEVLALGRVVGAPLLDPVRDVQLGAGQIAHHAKVIAQDQEQAVVLITPST
jgi:hypothetical protein